MRTPQTECRLYYSSAGIPLIHIEQKYKYKYNSKYEYKYKSKYTHWGDISVNPPDRVPPLLHQQAYLTASHIKYQNIHWLLLLFACLQALVKVRSEAGRAQIRLRAL